MRCKGAARLPDIRADRATTHRSSPRCNSRAVWHRSVVGSHAPSKYLPDSLAGCPSSAELKVVVCSEKSCPDLIWDAETRQVSNRPAPQRRNARFISRSAHRNVRFISRSAYRNVRFISRSAYRNVRFISRSAQLNHGKPQAPSPSVYPKKTRDKSRVTTVGQETKVSANGGSRTVGGHALSLWESVPSATGPDRKWIGFISQFSIIFQPSVPSPRPRSRTPSRWGGAGRA